MSILYGNLYLLEWLQNINEIIQNNEQFLQKNQKSLDSLSKKKYDIE